jgi:hypothetical protein
MISYATLYCSACLRPHPLVVEGEESQCCKAEVETAPRPAPRAVDPDDSCTFNYVCANCNVRFGEHLGYSCPEEDGSFIDSGSNRTVHE